MHSRVHSIYALTLHACAVVELRFVTERKKNEAQFISLVFFFGKPSNNHDLFVECTYMKLYFAGCWSLEREKQLLLSFFSFSQCINE